MSPSVTVTVDSTLGAASVGFFLSAVVFGVLTIQAFTYFRRYPSDKPAYKVLVAALWFLELVDQIFIGYTVYFYVVTNFQNPLFLISGKVIWPVVALVAVGALLGCIVKACFAMRVWRFSNRNTAITSGLLTIILVSFGFGITYAVKCTTVRSLLHADAIKMFATLALATGVVADISTAGFLCFFLRKLRTGHKKSDSLVDSLTIYAINTGCVTSIISTSTMILYNLFPDSFYFMGVYFILSQVYALSFFCTLNTRKALRGRGTDRETRSQSLFVVSHHRRTAHSQSRPKGIEIGVAHAVTVQSDVLHPDSDSEVVLEEPPFSPQPLIRMHNNHP